MSATLISDFMNLCQAIAVLGEATPRALDAVAALGERMSVRLLAAALDSAGVPAQYVEATQLIVTDRNFQNAHPDLAATQQRRAWCWIRSWTRARAGGDRLYRSHARRESPPPWAAAAAITPPASWGRPCRPTMSGSGPMWTA